MSVASARVRGCAGANRQADASRRRNGPRKATSRRLITVRLRSKSCLAGGHSAADREKVTSGNDAHLRAASTSAGECGVEDQVGRADVTHHQENGWLVIMAEVGING